MSDLVARFPSTAATVEEALRYYRNRATQLLSHGWSWDGEHVALGWGVLVYLVSPEGKRYASVFVLEGHTGQGHLSQWFATVPDVDFVTSNACEAMQSWLDAKGIRYHNLNPHYTRAYKAAQSFYSDYQAKRSGLHLMNHIDEGLDILVALEASQAVLDAWCLHPLLQSDDDLQATLAAGGHLWKQDPTALVLAMEYRHQANAHLSFHEPKAPTWGPLDEVKLMLIADKMQNRKDFELHLRGRDDVLNSDRLDTYFAEWFTALGITEDQYNNWVRSLLERTGQEPPCQ